MPEVGAGWRWYKWLSAIMTGVVFFTVLFLVPETQYDRDFSKSLMMLDEDRPGLPNTFHAEPNPIKENEKALQSQSRIEPLSQFTSPMQRPKKSYLRRLALWTEATPEAKSSSTIPLFLRPIPLAVYPCVVLATLGYAVSLAWVVAVNSLNSFILQAPPYDWSPAINGLINIPGFLGNFFGAFVGGWCVDKYCSTQTKHNGGIFNPEMRLPLLVVPALLTPAGCLAFGYGVERVLHWTALFFGYGMISIGLTAVSPLSGCMGRRSRLTDPPRRSPQSQ